MILFELNGGSESDPIYKQMEIANGNRQYDFLLTLVSVSLAVQRPFLSEHILKALNYQAITCLHTNAGEYRPCEVKVGTHEPPAFFRVHALMEDFVNTVNRWWEKADPVVLASLVLWRLNYIHPFINGNGRTARAAAYFVLCVKAGGLLGGTKTLPELLKRDRDEYVEALKAADASLKAGAPDLTVLHAMLTRLIQEQLNTANQANPAAVPAAPAPGPAAPAAQAPAAPAAPDPAAAPAAPNAPNAPNP